MIVSIINLKGGVGKTTSAMALAEAATRTGVRAIVLDCDPQASASTWDALVTDEGGDLPFDVRPGNIAVLRRLRDSEDAVTLIDCPPTGNVTDEAMRVADIVVVPSNPASADIQKTWDTVDALERNGKPYGVLLTKVNRQTRSYRATMRALEERGASVFDAQIPQREDLKNYFGNQFGEELFGYARAWDEIVAFMLEEGDANVA